MSKKIKVLFFQSQGYFGADSMIHSLLMRYYDRSRVEVHVACNPGSRHQKSPALEALETIPDIHIVRTNFGPTLTAQSGSNIARSLIHIIPALFSLCRLALYSRRHNIQIIHGTEKPRDAFYGVIMARLTGAKSVVHLHIKCTANHSPLTRWAMRKADAIIGVSRWVAQTTVEQGYAANKVRYVLNGLDTTLWDDTSDTDSVRREFGIASDAPLLSIVSRLFIWKGHTELLKALAIVRERVPNVKLLIVGEDDPRAHPGHRSYTGELKSLIERLGLIDNVTFTGYRKDVARILAASDIYAMPSYEEPFGMIFLEAMAMKRSVVALANGGTPEVVDHGKGGLLSDPGDIEALAANIVTLIRDQPLRDSMGRYNRTHVEEFFNPHRMATEMEQMYREVLRGKV